MSVLVANRHKGDMIFPRYVDGKIMSNFSISPGSVEPIDDQTWSLLKTNKIVQFYLDSGHLVVVNSADSSVDVVTERTSDPPIPPHLQDEEFEGGFGGKAKVKRSKSAGSSVVSVQ